jgi:hypothetical protein
MCIVIDAPSNINLMKKAINNSYSQILFFKQTEQSAFQNYAYYEPLNNAKNYTLFTGPIRPTSIDEYDDMCRLGLTNGIFQPSSPLFLQEFWRNRTFCANYFCNNESSIYHWYRRAANTNKTSDENRLIHVSWMNICILCDIALNQTSFFTPLSQKQCVLSTNTDYCPSDEKSECGNQTQCIYTWVSNSMCYDSVTQRYYYSMDIPNTVYLRFYVFYGHVITFIVSIVLLIVTISLVAIPSINKTRQELLEVSEVLLHGNNIGLKLRKVFSLYNQNILHLIVGQFVCLVLSAIDFDTSTKLYTIGLFVATTLIVAAFINWTIIMLHDIESSRSKTQTTMNVYFMVLMGVAYLCLICYFIFGFTVLSNLIITGAFYVNARTVILALIVVIFFFNFIAWFLLGLLTFLWFRSLANKNVGFWTKVRVFLQTKYLTTSILLVTCLMIFNLFLVIVAVFTLLEKNQGNRVFTNSVYFIFSVFAIMRFVLASSISILGLVNRGALRVTYCEKCKVKSMFRNSKGEGELHVTFLDGPDDSL